MLSLLTTLLASSTAAPTAPNRLPLATFGDKSSTAYKWAEQNDPVMGGQSSGNWSIVEDHGHFTGVVRNVSFLKAPGFCRATTIQPFFKDASAYLSGGIELVIRTDTPNFNGYRFAFSAVGVPAHNGGHEVLNSYKQTFAIPATSNGAYSTVVLKFSDFSWDWSDFTGSCETKDPGTGYQHKCCSASTPEVCPNAKTLKAIDGFSIWSEGAEGTFTVDLKSVAAVM